MFISKYYFESQMRRLIETFGERTYPAERLQLIYNLVKESNEIDFERFVSKCILDCKFAPLGQEFKVFANEQRDKLQRQENAVNKPIAFEDSIFSESEIKQHFQVMKDVMLGKISIKQASEYADCVRSALKEYGIKYET